MKHNRTVAIIGLGYVGLPVAIALGKLGSVVGFDVNKNRIDQLKNGTDNTLEVTATDLSAANILYTSDILDIADCNFYIIAVPTPVDIHKNPDLNPLIAASRTVGRVLKPKDIVVYESTVYPGCTEDVCVPILAAESGLVYNRDFEVGYSPERINPGDKSRTLSKITKLLSASSVAALDEVAKVYNSIIEAGTYRCSSIKVAEAAKVIENTQRDLNIALMNELALLFDRLDIDTLEVLAAAGTKWNFLPFRPGLVGGHCLKPTAMIMMADGTEKPIADIKVGDEVISHKGLPRKVLKTISHEYDGDMYSIYAKGTYFPLQTTCDHKVYASLWRRENVTRNRVMDAPEMVKSSQLLIHSKRGICHRLYQHGSCIGTAGDPKLARLLGLYLAEGSVDGQKDQDPKRIRLAFHEDEHDLHEDTKRLFKECFEVETTIRKPHEGKCLVVEANSKAATAVLTRLGGKLSWEKRLAPEIFMWSKEALFALWNGWFDGDGSYNDKGDVAVTVSYQLARDMYRIGLMLGMSLSIRKQVNNEKRDAYYLEILKHNYRNTDHRTVNIEKIEIDNYKGHVYDLEVDTDHSFIADTFVVSNCISVDPYYLTHKALAVGYNPELILAGRRINDYMASHIASKAIKLMLKRNLAPCDIHVYGLTFKADCPDTRNSKVLDIINELRSYDMNVTAYDPHVSTPDMRRMFKTDLTNVNSKKSIAIVAVDHMQFKDTDLFDDYSVVLDIKGIVKPKEGQLVWRL